MLHPTPVLHQVDRRARDVRTAGPTVPGVRRVLVVRTDRLGDLVVTLPAIRLLRRAYPGAWVGALVRPALAPLARIAADVDEVVNAPESIADLTVAFASFRADLTVLISRSARQVLAARRAGESRLIGTGYRWYSPWLTRRVDERRSAGERHEVEYALSFAHRVGGEPADAQFPIVLPEAVRDAADSWIAMQRLGERFVVLHPGSGGSCPNWPLSNYVELAALLEGQGIRVAFSIGPGDLEVERALEWEHPRIRRLPRFANALVPLAGLLQRAGLVVGSSTGPIHLAAALGAPTLALHAPWPSCGASRWGPYSARGWSLIADLPEAHGWSRGTRRAKGGELLAGIAPVDAARCAEAMVDGRVPVLQAFTPSTG